MSHGFGNRPQLPFALSDMIPYPRTARVVNELADKPYYTWDEWRRLLGAARHEGWLPNRTARIIEQCRKARADNITAFVFWTLLHGIIPQEREDDPERPQDRPQEKLEDPQDETTV